MHYVIKPEVEGREVRTSHREKAEKQCRLVRLKVSYWYRQGNYTFWA